MFPKRPFELLRQHGQPILHPFAVMHDNLICAETDVVNAEPKALHQAQSGPYIRLAISHLSRFI
jgi:hypothetical protein